jgi:hypothetical protein
MALPSINYNRILSLLLVFFLLSSSGLSSQEKTNIPEYHPRLLGSGQHLQKLSTERSEAYLRMKSVAQKNEETFQHIISRALVGAIENDSLLAKKAVEQAMKIVNGPIRVGHVGFGTDLALTALVYDLCHPYWTADERIKFHQYMNNTIDANVNSETAVFHNGWYGYKNWGIGIACFATYYENERAPSYLQTLEKDYSERAAPALAFAGNGGGWGEGYYINYFIYEWLFFCEVAKNCGDNFYYEQAPQFYQNRAVAGMFESYPGLKEYNSHRPIPMGDGGGRIYGGDRDKALSSRRILVNLFRDDPTHQIVHTFNEKTPRSGTGINAYMDFIWRDTSVPKGNLNNFRLSHYSQGAGYVYARSSWDDDATYFFFKCGNRFTSHQHLDVGHFLIYRHEELLGDGGHYDSFGSFHDVNYHLRTIAHNTLLVFNPEEKWPAIRAGNVTGNDGGQMHNFPHHNGSVSDLQAWLKNKNLYSIGEIIDFEDNGEYLYVSGDCSRAYSTDKMDYFTRQVLFIRPSAFIIFDRIKSKKPEYKKTLLLQAMKPPVEQGKNFVINHGKGKLFVQNLLPVNPAIQFISGENLYRYNGNTYPSGKNTGTAPECRVEISPAEESEQDYFLTLLTTAESGTAEVPIAIAEEENDSVTVCVGEYTVQFSKNEVRINVKKELSSGTKNNPESGFSEITIYPNPANSKLNVGKAENGRNSANIAVYSLNGHKIYETLDEVHLPFEMDISSFSRGLYLVKLSSGNKNLVKKITIE